MKTHLILSAASLLLVAAGCEDQGPGPIVGGPCSYDTEVIEATVIETGEDGATFEGPDGAFFVSGDYIDPVPAVGETLTLERDRITEGTCTPEIYRVADPD